MFSIYLLVVKIHTGKAIVLVNWQWNEALDYLELRSNMQCQGLCSIWIKKAHPMISKNILQLMVGTIMSFKNGVYVI